jgi:putative lipoic acid-binding regulatory protein
MSGPTSDQSLIEYPCDFPIKVMGRRVDGFAQAVVEIVQRHDVGFDPSTLGLRASSGGNYLGLTVVVRATSRQQLDALYRELTAHPMVSYVL